MKSKVVLCGVGGQGILLTSSIIGQTLTREGHYVTISEVHGMAQRGGEVISTLSIGGYKGAIAGKGEAKVLVGFEPSETYKRLDLASKDTVVITNTHPIIPPTVSLGLSEYAPVEEMVGNMCQVAGTVVAIDANTIAREVGGEIAANIVLLGALVATDVLPVSKEDIVEGIKLRVPERFLELNLAAFEAGYKAGKEGIACSG